MVDPFEQKQMSSKPAKSKISRTILRRIVLEKVGFGVFPGRKIVLESSVLNGVKGRVYFVCVHVPVEFQHV